MKLRNKVIIFLALVISILLTINAAISFSINQYHEERREFSSTKLDLDRAIKALNNEIENLNILCYDWAVWDEAYDFLKGENDSFIESNITIETFQNLKIDLLVYKKHPEGELLGGSYDSKSGTLTPISHSLVELLSDNDNLLNYPDVNDGISGIINLLDGPIIVSSRYVLRSNEEGPSTGILIMGRYLNKDLIRKLMGMTKLSIELSSYREPLTQEYIDAKSELDKNIINYIKPLNKYSIAGYTLIQDVFSKPALILRIDNNRDAHLNNMRILYLNIFLNLIIGFIIGFMLIMLINRMLLTRLSSLSESVESITKSGNLSNRVILEGKDELALLANSVNQMLDSIENSQKELKEKEQLYRTLFENTGTAICIEDNDNTIILVNKKYEEISGYSQEEIVGKMAWTDFVSPDELPLLLKYHNLRRIEPDSVPKNYEYKFKKKDGSYLDSFVTVEMIPGTKQNIASIMDITHLKSTEERLNEAMEQLKRTVNGAVYALAVSTELKDPYTAGHQERVSKLALAISKELGLSEDELEAVKVAGLLHDVGKIYIPAEILTKPRTLTSIEFDIVRTHSQAGFDILKNVEFSWPIADITLQHHERIDGSGYPHRLKDRQIHHLAKIVGVADVVEAMLSHRPYRPAHSLKFTMQEIIDNKGVLYDSLVVETCVKLFMEKGFNF